MRVSFAHFVVIVMVMIEAPLLAQWSAPQQVALDPEFDGYTMLTPHVLHTLRKDNVLFVTISASRGCSMARVVAPPLREYMESVGVPIYLVDTSSHTFVKEVTQPTGTVPLILVFKGERLIDGQLGFGSGADEGFFGAMVRRLGLPPSEHGLDYPSPAPFRFRDNWKRYSKGFCGPVAASHSQRSTSVEQT
ncbi:MAG: hypothetical protein R3E66_00230 [bacterium]